MPGTKFLLKGHARLDIARIRRYTIDAWGSDQWIKYKSALLKKLQALADNPETGIVLNDVSPRAYRFPIKNYVIYYLKRDSDVVFVGVLSAKMAPIKHLERKQDLSKID
jgi:toxin ParE1/3/4